jgi:hypothetical protein
MDLDSEQNTAREAKALVALAFRHGPIEAVHAGKSCPTCDGQVGYRHITGPEMKAIMKHAVDEMYRLLRLKAEDPSMYQAEIRRGSAHTETWDDPVTLHSGEASKASASPARLPAAGVLVTMPLAPLRSILQGSDEPPSFAQRRNRLQDLVSYIGFTIENRGMAAAHECKMERDHLSLLVAGNDANAIASELRSYLQLFNLPEGTKVVLFPGPSSPPHEIALH